MKKTKIVATISDLRCDVSFLRELYRNGVNVMRLNTAHQSLEDSKKVIENIRAVSNRIAIMIDTKGPEVRIMDLKEDLVVKAGDEVCFRSVRAKDEDCVYVNYEGFVDDVSVGSLVYLDDAKIELEVIGKKDGALKLKVLNDGIIKNKKSVNVPGVSLNYPSLIPKDVEYIEYAAKNGIDFIAHSFVRHKEDVLGVKKLIAKHGGKTGVVAKIENQEGLNNIEEILDEVEAVMIARGDLAVEIPIEKVPLAQSTLIKACIRRRKPVIVATQMMQSMCESPRPTRAEVSDVANAIRLGADAIMTSDETTMGKYPVETIKMMGRIAREVEKEFTEINRFAVESVDCEVFSFLSEMAVRASDKLKVKAIVCDTVTGRTALNLAAFRGGKLVFVECYDEAVMRKLALSYGVYSAYMDRNEMGSDFVGLALTELLKREEWGEDDLVVVLAGNYGAKNGASFVEVSSVKNLMKGCGVIRRGCLG